MIHSRMELGMKHYAHAYPDTDIVLIEPDHRDPELYLANTFSYAATQANLAEHAYQQDPPDASISQNRPVRRTGAATALRLRPRCAGRPQASPLAPRPSHPPVSGAAIGYTARDVMDDLGERGGLAREPPTEEHCTMVKKAPRRTAERILEVTLELFNRFGEPNVSTTLISAELGISPGNLYYHYPAKDELINSLFDRYGTCA